MLEFSVLLQVALSGPHGLGDEATFVWQKKKKNPCFKLMGKTDAHKLSKS